MTVYEFCELNVWQEDKIRLWSGDKEAYVFSGTFKEAAKSPYAMSLVTSFEINQSMFVLNIKGGLV